MYQYTSSPVADAEAYYTTTPMQAARQEAEQNIREAFASYFGGDASAEVINVTYMPGSICLGEKFTPVAEVVADALVMSDECEEALRLLLIGTGTVQQLRDAIVADYLEAKVEEVADLYLQMKADDGVEA